MKVIVAIIIGLVLTATTGIVWFRTTHGPGAPTPELLKLYGGRNGFATLQKAERVEAFRLNHRGTQTPPTITEGPVTVSPSVAAELTSVLSSHQAYGWDFAKGCVPYWGVQLSFFRGTDRVDVLLCFQCDLLMVNLNGTTVGDEDFDPIRPNLVRAVKAIFPSDQALQALPEKH